MSACIIPRSEADMRLEDIIPFHAPIAPSCAGWHKSCLVSKGEDSRFSRIKASNALFLKIQAPTATAYRRGGGKAWPPSARLGGKSLPPRHGNSPFKEFNMSLSAIPTSLSATLSAASFHPRGHHRGSHVDNGIAGSGIAGSGSGIGSGAIGSVGQLPVGATTGLFSNLLQSLEQVVGAQSSTSVSAAAGVPAAASGAAAATAVSGASPAAATAPLSQNLQAFMHSLFQALQQDGLGSGAGASAAAGVPAAASGAPVAAAASGQYQQGFISSLQTLIQQLGANGPTNAATSSLSAAFNQLVNGVNGAAASSSSQPPNSTLQNFLNTLLQNLQASGVQSASSLGAAVNARV
jgi:hypothetical protein